jgi:hypothetical protein
MGGLRVSLNGNDTSSFGVFAGLIFSHPANGLPRGEPSQPDPEERGDGGEDDERNHRDASPSAGGGRR